ncbi:MAG: glycosyltransferase [Lapillicoccus sp.]
MALAPRVPSRRDAVTEAGAAVTPARDEPRPSVSVCMAAHDGAPWIEEMLASVLAQLAPGDEVIVVDDASTDDTASLVEAIADPRIWLHRNETNLGYVRAFDRAMRISTGDIVLLADQDDVWVPGRVEAMVAALRTHAVVATSVAVLGEPLVPPRWPLSARQSSRRLTNLAALLVGVRWYFGCAMGLRRDILETVLPIPRWVTESHDLWIGIVGNVQGEMVHLEAPSVARRLHDDNQTPVGWRGPSQILGARWMLVRCIRVALRRTRRLRSRV